MCFMYLRNGSQIFIMAKTKIQKEEEIKYITDVLKKHDGFILAGFSGLSVNELNAFRRTLRESGSVMRIAKRRLLRIALQQAGISLNIPERFLGQAGFIPFSGDISDIAGTVYRFVKKHDGTIFDSFDIKGKQVIEASFLERIGQLPPRDEMLGLVVGTISAPLRALAYVVSQIKGE